MLLILEKSALNSSVLTNCVLESGDTIQEFLTWDGADAWDNSGIWLEKKV